jgi:Helix-turn-helix domain
MRYESSCKFLAGALPSAPVKELTTTEAATQLGVAVVTVRLWCKQGRFPGARSVETPRGPVWYIPENELRGVEPRKPGPKPPAETTDRLNAAFRKATESDGKLSEGTPAGQHRGTIASQTKTTRKLDATVKQAADRAMGGKEKGKK